jgi:hypothetical protein
MRDRRPLYLQRVFTATLVVQLALLVLYPLATAAQGYDVTLLEFPGAVDTFARGVNERGVVVGGYALPGAPFRGFVYDRSFADFVVPGATHDTQAWAINNAGHIVGRFQPDGQDVKGFLYDGTFTTLEFPGATRTEALGIVRRAHVVWRRLAGHSQALGVLCGQDSEGRQTERAPCRTTDEVRARHQPQDCQGARSHHPAVAAAAGGRGN